MTLDNIIKLAELFDRDPEWIHDCITGENGRILPNVANILVALRADPKLKDCFAFDQMLQAPLLMRPLNNSEGFEPRPLTDTDVTRFQEWLQLAGLRSISKEMMHQAVDVRAEDDTPDADDAFSHTTLYAHTGQKNGPHT